MANINHEIKIQGSLEKTFKALSHINDLKAWHTAHIEEIPELNGVLSFEGTDRPVFLWKIVQLEPSQTVIWECIDGPGDSTGTKAIYTVSKLEDNRTLVELSHTAWPDEEGNFRKCNTLWGILVHHLKNYIETGKIDPAIH